MNTDPKPSTIDITPSPRVLRMLGMIDFAPWQCLAELIDNSIDSFLDERGEGGFISPARVVIELPSQTQLSTKDAFIAVRDNGPGMNLDQLKNSVKAGYSGNDPVEKMGLFGMGFNISTARLGGRTQMWTTMLNSDIWVGVDIDFDELQATGTFQAPVLTREKSQEEIDELVHGTEIRISKLDPQRMRPLTWGSGKSRTRQKLGKIYGKVMSELGITINYDGSPIKAFRHCVWDESRSVPTKEFGNVKSRIEIDEEISDCKFCMTCWVWLLETDDNCPSCGLTEDISVRKRTVKGWLGIQRYFHKQHFGIDLIRNGRVIEELDKSLFSFNTEDGNDMFEYPIDTTHWGGRIIGELEIDFVRVSHQKDAFDKLDPQWAEVVDRIRT